jgi:heat shock protein HslJ
MLFHTIVGGDAVVTPPANSNIYFLREADGAVSGSTGCNQFNGTVSIDGDIITFSPLATTKRACEEELMSFETAVLQILENSAKVTVEGNLLTLSNADGLPLATFVAAEQKTLFVGPEQVDCVGVAPQKCLLIKESIEDDYTYFYDAISGFAWEAGYEYELLVAISEVQEPIPADASSLNYQLIEIVSQTAVSPDKNESESADVAHLPIVATVWQWIRFEDASGLNNIEVENPSSYTIEFLEDGTYVLKNDCNSGGGSYTADDATLTINPGITTLAACGEESLDQQFSQDLFAVVTYVLADGELYLNLQMDAGNMVFAPAQ